MTARSRGKRPARTRTAPRTSNLDRDEILELTQEFADAYTELQELKTAVLATDSTATLESVLHTFLDRLVRPASFRIRLLIAQFLFLFL